MKISFLVVAKRGWEVSTFLLALFLHAVRPTFTADIGRVRNLRTETKKGRDARSAIASQNQKTEICSIRVHSNSKTTEFTSLSSTERAEELKLKTKSRLCVCICKFDQSCIQSFTKGKKCSCGGQVWLTPIIGKNSSWRDNVFSNYCNNSTQCSEFYSKHARHSHGCQSRISSPVKFFLACVCLQSFFASELQHAYCE